MDERKHKICCMYDNLREIAWTGEVRIVSFGENISLAGFLSELYISLPLPFLTISVAHSIENIFRILLSLGWGRRWKSMYLEFIHLAVPLQYLLGTVLDAGDSGKHLVSFC